MKSLLKTIKINLLVRPQVGTGLKHEQWSGVLPLVRRIFGELAAQDFVSVQPMNLPSGLIFYLDFRYGTDQSNFDLNQNVHGVTSPFW